MMEKIGIVGMGFVGNAVYNGFKDKYETIPYDKYKKKYSDIKRLEQATMIFVCVPTPMKKTGEIDPSIVYSVIKDLEGLNLKKYAIIIIKSTIIPDIAEGMQKVSKLNIAFNPEFLTERTANRDFVTANRVVIGTNNTATFNRIKRMYKRILPYASYFKTDAKTAVMVKYATNALLAGQVGLANEIYQICEKLGIKYKDIKRALFLDERMGRHINVPGPDGKLGFGGHCLPKDLMALIECSVKHNYHPQLLKELWSSNRRIRPE
jgi:UDPglucose 6-dehydrogenase